jgi:hypothetical protein
MSKPIFGKRKSFFGALIPPALEEDGKKRFSASENNFLEPLSLHQGTGSGGRWLRNDFRQARITLWSPYPSTRHRLWRKMVKHDFRQAKITLWAFTPRRHQLWRKMEKKNDFRQAKITFWSPYPSTRHRLWRKMIKKDFRQAKISFSTPSRAASANHFLEPLPLHKAPALEENPYPSTLHQLWRKTVKKKRFSASVNPF